MQRLRTFVFCCFVVSAITVVFLQFRGIIVVSTSSTLSFNSREYYQWAEAGVPALQQQQPQYLGQNNNDDDKVSSRQGLPTTTAHKEGTAVKNVSSTSSTTTTTTTNRRLFVPVHQDDIIMAKGSNRSPIVIEQYKLIFFSIQKAGGTVWKQLLRRMLGHADWKTGPTWVVKDNNDNDNNDNEGVVLLTDPGFVQLNSFDLDTATQIMNDPTYTRATMVRDPKERFLSAYLDKAMQTDFFLQECLYPEKKKQIQQKKKKKQKNNNMFQTVVCKPNKKFDCTFSQFINITETCYDTHWAPQSDRMEEKYLPLLDFVGHLETAAQDAKDLLERIGAWDEFGKSGWGPYGNESIFQSNNVLHKTADDSSSSSARLSKYYTPELEERVAQRLQKDYDVPQFQLELKKIQYDTTTI